MKNVTVDRCLLLLTCTAAVSISSGCRSVPGMSMFSLRSKPSAEALAGTGPSTTYPVPPSESATPQAIASVAGGTSGSSTTPETTQVGGFDVSPGYATPAANLAAAQANGIYSGASSPAFDPSAAAQAGPSGYSFGSKAFTPKAPASPPDSSSYTLAGMGTPPSGGVTAPSTSFTPPTSNGFAPPTSNGFAPPPMNNYTTPSPPPRSGGFDLPSDPPSLAAGTTPGISFPSAESVTPSTTESESSVAAPSFSTASVAPTIHAPSPTTSSAPISGGSSFSGGGYSPGSTGTALEYPMGNETPTTNGSIFR